MSERPPDTLVLDTTALINFRGEGLFDLLCRLTGCVLVTTGYIVQKELVYADTSEAVRRAIGAGSLAVVDLTTIEELSLWERLSARLARGEASALAYAAERGHLFLTDDQDCHSAACHLIGVDRCRRSCRLLADALDRWLLTPSEAGVLFSQWREEEFRMPWGSLQQLWEEVFPEKPFPE